MPELPELNPVIHGKLRLALLSLLSGVVEAEFTWLRAKTGSTDGNLGAQLMKLEEAGYVAVEKKFVQRKPQTLYRMTEGGRQALTDYVQALKRLLGAAIEAKALEGSAPLVIAGREMCSLRPVAITFAGPRYFANRTANLHAVPVAPFTKAVSPALR